MRIVGGQFKGRKFTPPAKKWPTRPTTDFAKEALFNILNNHLDFESTKALDLFGGTGSHSYELISRGCEDVTYVDKFGGCVAFVKETAKTLKIEENIKIVRGDVFKFIESRSGKYDYIFCGPPYPLPRLIDIADKIFANELLAEDGWLVVEHDERHSFKTHERFYEERNYGGTVFSFFR